MILRQALWKTRSAYQGEGFDSFNLPDADVFTDSEDMNDCITTLVGDIVGRLRQKVDGRAFAPCVVCSLPITLGKVADLSTETHRRRRRLRINHPFPEGTAEMARIQRQPLDPFRHCYLFPPFVSSSLRFALIYLSKEPTGSKANGGSTGAHPPRPNRAQLLGQQVESQSRLHRRRLDHHRKGASPPICHDLKNLC